MIKKLKSIFSSELAKGSLILVASTLIFNILNYVFHFSMARMLGPADYGVLASLMSIIYLFSIPAETIQTIVARYTAIFKIRNENGKIKSLMKRAIKTCWKWGLIGAGILLILAPFLSEFLKFDSVMPLLILSLIIFPVLLLPVTRGILQGTKRFGALGVNLSLEGILKLALAIILVLIGFKVNGAIGSIVISAFLVFFISLSYLKNINKKKDTYFDKKEIYVYSKPVLIALIFLTLMYSVDMIIAKHFFSEQDAGVYAVASLLGKMIFFGLSPVAKAMFPIVAERKESKEEYKHILRKALYIATLASGLILAVYLLFSNLIVSVLFGNQYLAASSLIFYLGIGFALMTISYILVFYNLSIGRNKIVWSLPFFAVSEVILLSIFSNSLLKFSLAFSTVSLITCLFLIFLNRRNK